MHGGGDTPEEQGAQWEVLGPLLRGMLVLPAPRSHNTHLAATMDTSIHDVIRQADNNDVPQALVEALSQVSRQAGERGQQAEEAVKNFLSLQNGFRNDTATANGASHAGRFG